MGIQPGIYPATVVEHHWTTSQSGHPGLAITVQISDGWENPQMVGTIWFTPKSGAMARQQLRELGFNPDTQHCNEIGQSVSLVDHQCDVQLTEEEYRGRTAVKITKFGGLPKPPTAAQLAALDGMLARAKKLDQDQDDEDAGPPSSSYVPPPPPEARPEPKPEPQAAPPPAEGGPKPAADADGCPF